MVLIAAICYSGPILMEFINAICTYIEKWRKGTLQTPGQHKNTLCKGIIRTRATVDRTRQWDTLRPMLPNKDANCNSNNRWTGNDVDINDEEERGVLVDDAKIEDTKEQG